MSYSAPSRWLACAVPPQPPQPLQCAALVFESSPACKPFQFQLQNSQLKFLTLTPLNLHLAMTSDSSLNWFYETWFDQLTVLVHQRITAPKPPKTEEELTLLSQLVQKLISHYDEFYEVKSAVIDRDVLTVIAAPWATAFEKSLHWIAGWRPTTLFHLVYTESSIQFESHIFDILRGFRTGDLGDLTPNQFRRVSELQCETVKVENAITEELSEWQDGAAEIIAPSFNLSEKIRGLATVVRKADNLRITTLKKLVNMLNPLQAVDLLVAAAELQLGVHGWGSVQDRKRS